jgi:hypothetical protein
MTEPDVGRGVSPVAYASWPSHGDAQNSALEGQTPRRATASRRACRSDPPVTHSSHPIIRTCFLSGRFTEFFCSQQDANRRSSLQGPAGCYPPHPLHPACRRHFYKNP